MKFITYGGQNIGDYLAHQNKTEFDSSSYDDIFKDTDYWDTYQAILNQYKDGVPQQFFGFLGADNMNAYNHNQARMDAINALIEQKRSDEYNSTSSQVERDRAAGLNPDLLGASGGEPSDSSTTPNQKPMHFENPVPHIVSFMSMVGNAAIGAQSMLSQKVVNDSMRLQNLSLSKDIVLNDLGSINPFEEGDIKPAFKLGYNTGSRSLDKKLETLATRLYGDVEHQLAYRSRNKDINAIRKENFDIISSAGYSDDDIVYNKTAEFIADQQLLINKLEMDSNESSAKTQSTRKKLWNDAIKAETAYVRWLKKRASKGNRMASRVLMYMSAEPGSGEGAVGSALNAVGKLIK